MKIRTMILVVTVALILAVAAELLLAIPSRSECGTPVIDMMPCQYSGRVTWHLQQGSWLLPVCFVGLITVICLISCVIEFKQKK